MTKTQRLNKKKTVFKRVAQIETLESRQLLSANTLTTATFELESPSALYAEALPQPKYVVDTNLDKVDAEDGYTSLREALEKAQAGEVIGFSSDLDSVQLENSISGKDGVTIQSSNAGIEILAGVNIPSPISILMVFSFRTRT